MARVVQFSIERYGFSFRLMQPELLQRRRNFSARACVLGAIERSHPRAAMSEDSRATLTIGLWFLSALALIALFISAAAQSELTPGHILIAFTILGLAIAGTPYLLHMKPPEGQQEKSKRLRIEKLLNEMGDDDLIELKRRLSEVDLDEPVSVAALGDDGELIQRS
jgi:hypothetical protein